MNTPTLLLRPALDKKAYRLKARFKIEPYPRTERLEREKVRIAEVFVQEKKKQGWDYVPRYGFTMKGPFPYVAPMTIHRPPVLSARAMATNVAQGARYLDMGGSMASEMPVLNATEWWEFELRGVFARTQIMTEVPDLHEEK